MKSTPIRRIEMKLKSMNPPVSSFARGMLIAGAALSLISTNGYAQTPMRDGQHQLTRAAVRAELIELESIGYNPALSYEVEYPNDIIEAQKRLFEKRRAAKVSGASPSQ
jgi:hypothetical protein